jgi:hypothetical protein
MTPDSAAVLVVVCHYNARPVGDLLRLLGQLKTLPAGFPFDIRVVVNLATPKRLLLPSAFNDVEVLYRENVGYNIGAWEHGWRQGPPHAGYLFVQEECRLVREGWVAGFVQRAAEPGIGLVGECLSPHWDAPWDELARRFAGQMLPEHRIGDSPAERVPCYLDFLRRQSIYPGERGDHLQSLVLYARRDVLKAIDGLPVGSNYGEAIAAEIGISKKVQSLGLRLAEAGPSSFWYIEHPQWLHRQCERSKA